MRDAFRAAVILIALGLVFGGFALAEESDPPPSGTRIESVLDALPPGVVHFQVRIENTDEGFVEMPRPAEPEVQLGRSAPTIGSDLSTPGSGLPTVGGAIVGVRGGGGGEIPRIEKTERVIKTVIRKLG